MSGQKTDIPLIRTKFNRPSLPSDFVPRAKLLEILNHSLQRRLTLVSAPAGYGKSTLVTSWLESCGCPGSWLSLNENDNDLRDFLEYFVTAIRSLHPQACPRTMTLLGAPSTPSLEILSAELVNELDVIESPYIVALDDYGFIHLPQIHNLLTFLLEHAPDTLHLVVLTRRDPPLPFVSLRANGELVEIRGVDLKFTESEAAQFIKNTVNAPFDEASLLRLYELTEGWPTGLRLTALSLRYRDDVKDFMREMSGDIRHIQDYLMSEVLDHQDPAIRNGLLKTSILNRFSYPLVETVCGPEIDGQVFLDHLEHSNLFCIHLDEKQEWHRYHHLFQELLQRNLELRYSVQEIEALHSEAGAWFIENGHFEDGLHHILKCGDPVKAGHVVAQNRGMIMAEEGHHRLRSLIKMLPPHIVDNEPELLLAQAWSMIGFIELHTVLDRIKILLETMPHETSTADRLKGEYYTLLSLKHMHLGQSQETLTTAQRALELLPEEGVSERSFATIELAMAHQMMGKLEAGRSIALDGLDKKEHHKTTYHARMLAALCFVHWMEADLTTVMETADQYIKLGHEARLPESIAHGHSFLGICHYERNELVKAEQHLAAVVHNAQVDNIINFVHSAFALALVHQSQGNSDKAEGMLELVRNWALEIHFPSLLDISGGVQTELHLRQGRVSEANLWTRTFNPHPFQGGYRFYVPHLTLAKVYIALNTEESLRKAEDLLSSLHAFFSSTHNKMFLLKVLTIQALLRYVQDDETAALSVLEEAVVLGEPGGFIRPFLDLGPSMADLLERFADRKGITSYLKKIQSSFGDNGRITTSESMDLPAASTDQFLLGSLTDREIQILQMLSRRLTNKEIAQQLFISPATVKRHTVNIYQKMDVNSRRQAVEKATSLGILAGT